VQKRILPSGFLTNKTGDAQADLLGFMSPASSSACTSLAIMALSFGPVLYAGFAMGLVFGYMVI
jgi:hypothetical protein